MQLAYDHEKYTSEWLTLSDGKVKLGQILFPSKFFLLFDFHALANWRRKSEKLGTCVQGDLAKRYYCRMEASEHHCFGFRPLSLVPDWAKSSLFSLIATFTSFPSFRDEHVRVGFDDFVCMQVMMYICARVVFDRLFRDFHSWWWMTGIVRVFVLVCIYACVYCMYVWSVCIYVYMCVYTHTHTHTPRSWFTGTGISVRYSHGCIGHIVFVSHSSQHGLWDTTYTTPCEIHADDQLIKHDIGHICLYAVPVQNHHFRGHVAYSTCNISYTACM